MRNGRLEVRQLIRAVTGAAALLVTSGCQLGEGPPARLAAVDSNTVVVNNQRPVQLPIQLLDAAGHVLPATGVHYQWMSGVPLSLSATGAAMCTQAGDATVRASLGSLATQLLVRCRPVRDVRALHALNLVVGDPPQEVPFEAVGVDGRPVTLLTGQVTVSDSTVATLEGTRVHARGPGHTWVSMRVGDREGATYVHVYERAPSPEGIRPGQHLVVPVRVHGGEMRRWRLAAARELYAIAMLPDGDTLQMPRLAIVGANCARGLHAHSFYCLALQDASVFVYHPQQADTARDFRGRLAVWRQENP